MLESMMMLATVNDSLKSKLEIRHISYSITNRRFTTSNKVGRSVALHSLARVAEA